MAENKKKRGPSIEPIDDSTMPAEMVTAPTIEDTISPVDGPTPAQGDMPRDEVKPDDLKVGSTDLRDRIFPNRLAAPSVVQGAHDAPVDAHAGTGGLNSPEAQPSYATAPGGEKVEPPAQPTAFDKGAAAKPAPAPMAPAAPAAPPGLQTVGVQSTTKTEQKKMTADEAIAQGRLDTETEQEKEIAGRQKDDDKILAQQELKRVQKSNAKQNDIDAERERITQAQNTAIEKLENHVAEKRAEYEKLATSSMGPEGFWRKSSRKPAAEFVAALSSGIGARNAIMYGGRNMIEDTINKRIDDEFRAQQQEIENRRDLLKLAKEDVTAAYAKKTGLLYDLQIKKIGLLDAAQREREELLAQHGVSGADIAKDAVLLGIQKKRDEEKANLAKDFRKTIESITTVQKAPGLPANAADPKAVYLPGSAQKLASAPSEKTAERVNDWIGAYGRMNGSLNEYRGLVRKYGSASVLPADVRGRMDKLRTDIIFEMNGLANKEGSAVRPGEIPFYETMIPKATGWEGTFTSRANMIAKLDEATKQMRRKTATELNGIGVKTDRDLLDQIEQGAGVVNRQAEGK